MKKLLVCGSLIFAASLGFADEPVPDPSPTASLDPNFLLLPAHDLERVTDATRPRTETTQVGDEVDLHATDIALPQGVVPEAIKVQLPQGAPPINEQGWEILQSSGKGSPAELSLSVVPLKPGQISLPSLAIVDASGKAIARTQPWTLEVKSAIRKDDPKPQEPAPTKPPVDLAFPLWVAVVAAVLLIVALSAAGYWLYRWNERRQAMLPPKPKGPPPTEDEAALAAFDELERSGILKKGAYKKYYFRVSEVLKVYIGRRYGFDAPECTTSEMFRILSESGWVDSKQAKDLQSLFERMDVVKFTDYVPSDQESALILPEARKFVLATKRRMVVEPILKEPSLGGPSAV